LRQTPPYDFDFYQKYIQMEKCSPISNEKFILDAYEDALIHFGKENIGNLFLL
jgi:hypothetical protein